MWSQTVKSILAAFAMLALLSGLTASEGAAPPPDSASTTPVPAPNWYNVEVILFRYTDPQAGAQETWPVDPGEPNWNGAVALNPADPANPALPYQLLTSASEQLTDQWNRLKHSHGQEPLLQIIWSQPALDRATAPAVRIGVPPSAVPMVVTGAAAVIVTPASTVSTSKAVAAAAPLQPTPIYGTLKLSTTGPYLHLDLDLVLRGLPLSATAAISAVSMSAPGAATNSSSTAAVPAFQLYRLTEDRRIDAGKVFYFDHPLFGALVLVTPVRKQ